VRRRLELRGRLHTFRHSFISNALTNGIPEAVVRKWVGHVDPDVMKLYTHIVDEASRAARQRLVNANNNSLQPEEKRHADEDGDSAQSRHSEGGEQNARSAN